MCPRVCTYKILSSNFAIFCTDTCSESGFVSLSIFVSHQVAHTKSPSLLKESSKYWLDTVCASFFFFLLWARVVDKVIEKEAEVSRDAEVSRLLSFFTFGLPAQHRLCDASLTFGTFLTALFLSLASDTAL